MTDRQIISSVKGGSRAIVYIQNKSGKKVLTEQSKQLNKKKITKFLISLS